MKLPKRLLEIVEERQKAAEFAAKIGARLDDDDQTLPVCTGSIPPTTTTA